MKHRLKRSPAVARKPAPAASPPQPQLCSPAAARKYSPAGPGLLFTNPAWQNETAEMGKAARLWSWCEWVRISLVAAALLAAGLATAARTLGRRAQRPTIVRYAPAPSPAQAAQPAAPAGNLAPSAIGPIHYWSDDGSTTVTVRLPRLVFFAAHRLTHPDRVYFDLQGTQMPVDLQGRLIQVEVSETFVQKIRVAEREPGVTRVVLETAPNCDYSAMIAPDPYRLVINLHRRE